VHLLRAVAKTDKPIILSTGGSNSGDIRQALGVLGEAVERTMLMYCASAYPSRRHNLYIMPELQKVFGRPVGFSDHSTDVIYTPLAAHRQFGAVCIEKHFTAFPDLATPDRGHSLNVDEFKIMVDYIRGKRDGGINPTSEEKDMFLRHNRRLIATRDIAIGDSLKYGENFGAYRSLEDDTKGLSPFVLTTKYSPEGRRATVAIARGKGVGPGDYQ
jgi:sialic acid synthase SpsE